MTWELYDLSKDWTQSDDVAAKYPEKLKEMKELFLKEARKYQVLPLDASVATRLVQPRPNITAGRTEFVYTRPLTGIPQGDSPLLLNTLLHDHRRHRSSRRRRRRHAADLRRPLRRLRFLPAQGQASVPLEPGRPEAHSLGRPGRARAGKHTIEFDFKYDGLGAGTLAFNNMSGIGRSGTGVLKVDGKEVATQKMEHTMPLILQWDETFDIGSDTGTPVDDKDYQVPFAFTGKLNKLTITMDRPKLTPEDEKRLMQGAASAADAQ